MSGEKKNYEPPTVVIIVLDTNTIRVEPSFFWNLIEKDPDDNKFTDLYISANADILVSNNTKDFKVLHRIAFPPIDWKTVKQMRKDMFL